MASLSNVSIRRPVATAMFYLILITIGVVGFRYLPIDLLPEIEFPRLTVYVNYPNVGPEEIETIITDPLENALSGVPGVERMTSQSEEGNGRVSLEFTRSTNLAEASGDVRAALDRIRDNLPEEAEPPGIWKFDPNSQEIVDIAATSTRPLDDLTRVLEREIAQRFEQIPGVGSIELRGGIYREIRVELRRDRLKASGLTGAEVQQAIAQENTTLPGGNIKRGIKDLYVRTLGEYRSVEQIANTVITNRNGRPIRVQDVAQVSDGYEDLSRMTELNGVPVVRLGLQKQSGANTVTVAERIREEVALINETRKDLELKITSDQSTFIQQSINSVQNAAFWGGLLAIFVLYLFLRNTSTTTIIALSIPISIIATFGLLYFAGLTLNQMTFGGLALGIGLIVDNAIVVLESIVRQREEEGKSLEESAQVGTREVAGAIVASTLTTSVIFLPVVFMRTTSGQLFQSLALVVVFALACSLLVALTLVPMLCSQFLTIEPPSEQKPRKRSWFQRKFEQLENWYADRLDGALEHRRVIFGAAAALLVGAVLLWPLIPVELAPQTDTDEIDIEMEMAQGTNLAVARTYLEELEGLVRPILPMEDVEIVATEVRGDGDAEVEIRMKPAGERSVNTTELADELRTAVAGQVPGADIRVQAQSGLWILRRLFSSGGGSEEVEVELRGYDLEEADKLAQQIKTRMEQTEGIVGARVGRREGRPEENILFDRERISNLGLSVEEVARAVQTSVGGSRAGYFRQGGEQFPITVRLRPADRLTSGDLENIAVKTPEGETVPVSTLTHSEQSRGPTEIRRINGQRVTYISANLESGVALGDAVERVQQNLSSLNLPEGFSIVYGGAYQEQQEAQRDFLIAVLMALALIYMVMAAQFERFLDPLVVMGAVPLALIGVVPTLLLTGTTLNVQSIMGLIMLIGIVVNNAIVLIDYVNLKRREQGLPIKQAVIEAARLRLRPILMTTLTTVLGLFPLALGWGAGANIQAALARVVIGGLTASTLITLVLIPALYISASWAAEKVSSFAKQWRSGGSSAAAPQPARP